MMLLICYLFIYLFDRLLTYLSFMSVVCLFVSFFIYSFSFASCMRYLFVDVSTHAQHASYKAISL